jgi:hypothetical protein
MSRYFEACERARAIRRLDQLKRLTDELHSLVHGATSTSDIKGKARRLQSCRLVCLPALCLGDVGNAAASPERRWLRTFARFYQLGTPAHESSPRSGAER